MSICSTPRHLLHPEAGQAAREEGQLFTQRDIPGATVGWIQMVHSYRRPASDFDFIQPIAFGVATVTSVFAVPAAALFDVGHALVLPAIAVKRAIQNARTPAKNLNPIYR